MKLLSRSSIACFVLFFVIVSGLCVIWTAHLNKWRRASGMPILIHHSAEGRLFRHTEWKPPGRLGPQEIPAALAYIKAYPDYTSYHLLLSVREDYPAFYSQIADHTKASILCDALGHSRSAEDWSELYISATKEYGIAGEALLETGLAALPFLIPILDDLCPAYQTCVDERWNPSKVYAYRRADFAYRYICLIKGWYPGFHPHPNDRDKAIHVLRNWLARAEREPEGHLSNIEILKDLATNRMALVYVGSLGWITLTSNEAWQASECIKRDPTYASYHLLFALRRDYPGLYAVIPTWKKAAILADGLRAGDLLDWDYVINGESSPWHGEGKEAMLEIGKAAIPYLKPILDMRGREKVYLCRFKPNYGEPYCIRRADYAYRYACLILGKEPITHRDPNVRDKQIEIITKELEK